MSSLIQDFSRYEAFKALLGQLEAFSADSHGFEVIEWNQSLSPNIPSPPSIFSGTVSQLARRSQPNIRIIFAPLDYPTPETLNLLLELFRLFSIPTDFISERVQSVTHSFGCTSNRDGGYSSWFHFLCKNIDSEHDNLLWKRSGYFLRSDAQHRTTLICFGASTALQERFKAVPNHSWNDALPDPFSLVPMVLSDLHLQLDEQVWNVCRPVGELERVREHIQKMGNLHHEPHPNDKQHTIQSTCKADDFGQDFIALHHIAKNIIHLKEASDAVLKTVSHMVQHHTEACQIGRSNHCSTSAALDYQQSLFESVNLRLTSLEKRMQNIINLSFNLVAQKDSNVILQESSSMHTIALTTLIFLPISTIATIFGTQFFNYDPAAPPQQKFRLAPSFWIFWIITVPLTLFVLTIWVYFHPSTLSRWIGLKRTPKSIREGKPGNFYRMRTTRELEGVEDP